MKRFRGWLLGGALVAGGCGPKDPAENATASSKAITPAPVVVTVAPVKPMPIARSISVVGTLNGYEEITLAPKADGRVIKAVADVGDVALPGQVLLELDPIDQQLAVAEAAEALQAELAKLGLSALPEKDLNLKDVPAVRRAAVAVQDAERKWKQRKDLFARQAGSADDVETAVTELRLAEANLLLAETESRAVLATARLRKASFDAAQQRLADCQLVVPEPYRWSAWAALVGPGFAPLRYSVAQRMVAEGEMVRAMPGTNAYRLVIASVLKLRTAVPERYSPEVQLGQIVEVLVEAFPQRAFPGRVHRINPTVDPLNRTFQVEVLVPNGSGELKVGGFAKANIQTRTDPAVLTVPYSAVLTFAGVTKVFVVEGGLARAIEVKLGTREKDHVEIIGPVAATAQVLTSGLTQVVDGGPIRIRENSAAATGGSN
ncbi:MAG: efflux RND transporter periplasmic adaptor subunit [Gemmataceae bacterium]